MHTYIYAYKYTEDLEHVVVVSLCCTSNIYTFILGEFIVRIETVDI